MYTRNTNDVAKTELVSEYEKFEVDAVAEKSPDILLIELQSKVAKIYKFRTDHQKYAMCLEPTYAKINQIMFLF